MPMFGVSVFPPYVSIVEPLAACSLSGVGLADGSANSRTRIYKEFYSIPPAPNIE